eukprot:3769146-Alexandrium_andersonii.AAC.1
MERGVWRKIGSASRQVENCLDAPQAELAAVGLAGGLLLASPVASRLAIIASERASPTSSPTPRLRRSSACRSLAACPAFALTL